METSSVADSALTKCCIQVRTDHEVHTATLQGIANICTCIIAWHHALYLLRVFHFSAFHFSGTSHTKTDDIGHKLSNGL